MVVGPTNVRIKTNTVEDDYSAIAELHGDWDRADDEFECALKPFLTWTPF